MYKANDIFSATAAQHQQSNRVCGVCLINFPHHISYAYLPNPMHVRRESSLFDFVVQFFNTYIACRLIYTKLTLICIHTLDTSINVCAHTTHMGAPPPPLPKSKPPSTPRKHHTVAAKRHQPRTFIAQDT